MFSTLLTAYVDNDDEFTGEHVYPNIDREELFDNPYLWKKQERRLSRPSHCLFTTAIYSLCFGSVGHRSATSMCHFSYALNWRRVTCTNTTCKDLYTVDG